MSGWRKLNVGVIGGGIGGMSVAIALRRSGHEVTVYEKSDYAGEVGASVSCAANGTRWLHEWGVDVAKGDPVILKKLINRDWKTGEPVSVYDLDDYKERWGYVYNMFHRQYMHAMLKDSALDEEGEGTPATLRVNHRVSWLGLGEPIFEGIELTMFSVGISTWKKAKSPLKTGLLQNTISSSVPTGLGLQSGGSWESGPRRDHPTRAVYMPMY